MIYYVYVLCSFRWIHFRFNPFSFDVTQCLNNRIMPTEFAILDSNCNLLFVGIDISLDSSSCHWREWEWWRFTLKSPKVFRASDISSFAIILFRYTNKHKYNKIKLLISWWQCEKLLYIVHRSGEEPQFNFVSIQAPYVFSLQWIRQKRNQFFTKFYQFYCAAYQFHFL